MGGAGPRLALLEREGQERRRRATPDPLHPGPAPGARHRHGPAHSLVAFTMRAIQQPRGVVVVEGVLLHHHHHLSRHTTVLTAALTALIP